MSIPPSAQPILETEAFKRQREDEIEKASRVCEELTRLMDETLASLLYCFQEPQSDGSCGFFTSIFENRKAETSYRDTAIVLTAIETAGKEVMDLTQSPSDSKGPSSSCKQFLKRLLERRSRPGPKPIQYSQFWHFFFKPCVEKILEEDILKKPLLEPKNADNQSRDDTAAVQCSRDPFSFARILGLLNLYRDQKTHGQVYVRAVEAVVDALCKTFRPNYAFGGASLPGAEPHAFVSYYCLNSLDGIRRIMENRAKEHEDLASLLTEIAEYQGQDSPTKLKYGNWKDLRSYLQGEVKRLEEGVGISAIVKAIGSSLDDGKNVPDQDKVRTAAKQPIHQDVVPWVTDFLGSVKKTIDDTNSAIDANFKEISKTAPDTADRPGQSSMEKAKRYMEGAGQTWKRAFFEGMQDVLTSIKTTYAPFKDTDGRLPADSDLLQIAKAIASVGGEWRRSASLTKDYIGKFTKWATAELHRQLSFYHVRFQTNFDPVQLAFLLRIHSDLSPEENRELTLKGLDILFESQQPDGIWPVGAPLFIDPRLLQAIYVANLEVINAVLPLVKRHERFDRYKENIERVSNWLRTNKKEITIVLSLKDQVPQEKTSVPIVGWATEKVAERGRIDVWLTALVLEFLYAYRDILMDFVNRATVQHKYDSQPPRELRDWKELIDPELSKAFEERVTTSIYRDYILPFREVGISEKNAMVLYGPPGTGKTQLAAAVAKELDWRLVTITPSDFVKEGIEKSESMARTLFNDLLKLHYAVVIFDEIDEMLKARSLTEEKPTAVAMLQFIVPGMLPKLQRLKKYGERNGVIIVLATNYFERLDPAVVRRGRMDDHFPIYPPDGKSRQLIIYNRLQDLLHSDNDQRKKEYMGFARDLSRFTGGWVFSELNGLVRLLVSQSKEDWATLFGNWNDPAWRAETIKKPDTGDKEDLFAKGYSFHVKGEAEKRSLNPLEVYGGRESAKGEAKSVFEVCQMDNGLKDRELKQLLNKTLKGKQIGWGSVFAWK